MSNSSESVNSIELPKRETLTVEECWEFLRSKVHGRMDKEIYERSRSGSDWNPRNQYRGADYATHSCRNGNSFGWSWAYFVKSSPAFELELDSLFDSIQFDFVEPRRLWSEFKGLWHLPMTQKIQTQFLESFNISKSLAFIEYLSQTDFQKSFAEFSGRSAELKIISEPAQKAIDNRRNEYSRTGKYADDSVFEAYLETRKSLVPIQIVSEAIMKRYIKALHKCEHFKIAGCVVCGEAFHPEGCQLLPTHGIPPVICESCVAVIDGIAHHAVIRRAKSPQTLSEQTVISSLLSSALLNFFNEYSYVPGSDLQRKNELSRISFASLDRSEFVHKFKLLAVVPPNYLAKLHFGSNASYLDSVGLFEGRAPQGGYRSLANDGHACLSIGERSICEFLFGLGIPHQKEPKYPSHPELNPKGLYRADYRVGEWFIEFAGRMAVPEYASRMRDKRKLAKEAQINLCILEPKDLVDLHTKLKKVLAQSSRVN